MKPVLIIIGAGLRFKYLSNCNPDAVSVSRRAGAPTGRRLPGRPGATREHVQPGRRHVGLIRRGRVFTVGPDVGYLTWHGGRAASFDSSRFSSTCTPVVGPLRRDVKHKDKGQVNVITAGRVLRCRRRSTPDSV